VTRPVRATRSRRARGQTIVVWSFAYFRPESEYFVALLRRLGYRARLHYIPDLATYFKSLIEIPGAQAGFAGWYDTQLGVDTARVGNYEANNVAVMLDQLWVR